MTKIHRRSVLRLAIAAPAVALIGCGETKQAPIVSTTPPPAKGDPGPPTAAPIRKK